MKRAAAVLAACCLLAAGACRTPLPPAQPLPPGDERPAQLLSALSDQARERRSLRGMARVAVDGPAGSGRASQVLVVERPARLRLELLGLFSQTLAVLVTDGERFDFFRVEDRHREAGPVYPGLLWDLAGLPLSPEEAVGLVLGAPEPLEGLRVLAAERFGEGGTRVDLGPAGGVPRQRFEFDALAQLRRLERRDAAGVLVWEAQFDDYRDVTGTAFPYTLQIRFPASRARAELSFREVELNPALPPRIFVLQVPSAGLRGRGESG